MGSSVIGMTLAFVIAYYTIDNTTDNYMSYFNLLGVIIVLGGTVAASVISFKIKDLFRLVLVVFRIFRAQTQTPKSVVKSLVNVGTAMHQGRSVGSQRNNKGTHPFIEDGLRLIENRLSSDQIKKIMSVSASERKQTFIQEMHMLEVLSKYPPAFGMMGTVLGLIALMAGLGNDPSKSSLGPNMSVALVTTLYGLLISNLIFQPLLDHINNKMKIEMQIRRIIIGGILLVNEGEDPVMLSEYLNAHLMPSEREEFNLPASTRGERAA